MQFDSDNWFWALADGRIWSTAASEFVAADADVVATWFAQTGCSVVPPSPVDANGEHSEAGLRQALTFYGLSLGVLATPEDMAATIRAERDRRIAATDYLVMPDYPIAAEELAAVTFYRQTLRDVPAQDGFPWGGDVAAVPWPEKPNI